jgi:penicillin amidase/acyl-homoserine-lactone acylase
LTDDSGPASVENRYDVRILRDTWGIPHVFGVTDADVAYGLAYANAEDDFETVQKTMLAARGTLASVYGRKAAPNDYLVHLLRVWDTVDAHYETTLSPEMRAIFEAYAEGLNHYASLHREELKPGVLPFRGEDVIAGVVHKVPLFFRLDNKLKELYEPERRREVSTRLEESAFGMTAAPGAGSGSNAYAVGPGRSADGKTRLCSNSHQPWEGPVAWYEVHLHSEEGWDTAGALFPGSPVVFHGHNRHLAWSSTVNWPDLVDIYVLDVHPENPNQYRFDGEWRELEVRKAPIKVKLWGPISWTFKREVLWSVYGPVLRRPHGTYAIRYAGMGEVRAIEQWYRVNKARNFEEWLDAMRMMAIPMFNFVYADRDQNIYYLYNGQIPVRAPGYDWSQYLPGDTSETLWTRYLPFEELPQVKNPASGFVQSCNNSPFQTTLGSENPTPDDFSPTLGIEKHMTSRGLRLLELLGSDESITEEEFFAYKYDLSYSPKSWVAAKVQEILALPPSDDPVVREAIEVVRAWDMRTDADNRNAAVGALTIAQFYGPTFREMEPPDLLETFTGVAHDLKRAYGRIDVPWSEVSRLRRGKVDLGLDGGPDILRAIKPRELAEGRAVAWGGDSFVLFVTWGPDGPRSRSINPYGSAVGHPDSPHYADQAPLFARKETKPVWFDEADIRANLEREYRPGEEHSR